MQTMYFALRLHSLAIWLNHEMRACPIDPTALFKTY